MVMSVVRILDAYSTGTVCLFLRVVPIRLFMCDYVDTLSI